jgi:hypothetical protein
LLVGVLEEVVVLVWEVVVGVGVGVAMVLVGVVLVDKEEQVGKHVVVLNLIQNLLKLNQKMKKMKKMKNLGKEELPLEVYFFYLIEIPYEFN